MNAEIITIGNEILSGLVVDTNSAFLGKELAKIGIQVDFRTSIADSEEHIIFSINQAIKRAKIVIITGGLGPTHDDITKKTLVEFFKTELVQDKKALEMVLARFQKFGYAKMPESNYEQALVPKSAKIIYNEVGTAQGSHFTEGETEIFSVPGVPSEMKWMFENYIKNFLKTKVKGVLLYKTLRSCGIGESSLWEKIGKAEEIFAGIEVASLPHFFGVDLRFKIKAKTQEEAEKIFAKAEKIVMEKVGASIFAKDEESLQEVVVSLLKTKNQKLATAESCTGGLISNLITNVSGSSEVFFGGVSVYSNEAKQKILGVKGETLEVFGAVSEQTVKEMAKGVLELSGADFSVAVTGIAGPKGGTKEKPVGTTWIGISTKTEVFAKKFIFAYDRLGNKERASNTALRLLWEKLVSENEI
ncbi:competence/damage-inducible protein A [bacterium]|nr:competence/damage-inducible protein A [bacterium]